MDKIVDRGYTPEVATEIYDTVAVFRGYGFAQGHALAFADISVRSVWCQQNFPADYFAALLDAQPAGYYGPYTLVNEARSRGVKILPPDVNLSDEKFSVEDVIAPTDPKLGIPRGGIRVGLKQIAGISDSTRRAIVAFRPFSSMFDFVAKVRPHRDELEILILAGVFDQFERNRRALLWAIPDAMQFADLVKAVEGNLPLQMQEPDVPDGISWMSPIEEAILERKILHLDVERHLVAFERDRIRNRGGITAAEAGRLPHGTRAFVVGNPIRLRFPPTSSGRRVMFFDLEDETGLLNVTCFDDVYQRDGHRVICSPFITLIGQAQVRDDHNAFLASRIYQYEPRMNAELQSTDALPIKTADFLMG